MRLFDRLLLIPLVLALTAPAVYALPRPDEPDQGTPFLRATAMDITRLVRAVQADPRARLRYAGIFHVPPSQVPLFLQKNFVPGLLPRTDLYTVSLVSHRGTIYPVWMTLPAGTPIFASRHSALMLLRASGDPVTPLSPVTPPEETDPPGEQVVVPNEPQIVPLPTTTVP